MSDAQYDYDENSETWPYFVLTGVLVPLIPATISFVLDQISSAKASPSGFKELSWFKPYNEKEQEQYQKRQKKASIFSKKLLFVIVGWIIVVLLALKIHHIDVAISDANFDPWKILGVDESTAEKDVKKAYRKLSLKFHPDKIDTSNMTQKEIDEVDSAFVRINKAYKALTDETVKENFAKYGNPDGPGEVKHGIALPKFLVEGTGSPLLVVVYILLIAVILPTVVAKWWYGVKSHTKRGLNTETASHFLELCFNYDPAKMPTVHSVLKDVSYSKEYLSISSKLTPQRVYEMLESQLNRTELSAKDEQTKLAVVSVTPRLLLGYLDIASAFRNPDVSYAIIEAHRSVIQALDIEADPNAYRYREILQLPSVELKNLDTSQKMYTLGKLLKKPTVEPSKFLGVDNTSKVLEAASQIPLIEPLECKFKVPGENIVPPNSHVHIDLRFVIKSPAIKGKPAESKLSEEVVKKQLEDPLTLENLRDPYKVVADQPKIILPTLPAYFPNASYIEENCGWVAFLAIQKDGKLGDVPAFLTHARMSNMSLSQEQMDKSEAEVSVFKFQVAMPTPGQAGKFQFRLILKNLVYFGSDLEIPLVMEVKDEPVEEEEKQHQLHSGSDEISSSDEKIFEAVSSSDEDESSSEDEDSEEEDSDWTDENTDTEDESDEKQN